MANGSQHTQKITTHLWYDKEAREAAEFYVSTFSDAVVKNTTTLQGTPTGSVDVVEIELFGQEFTLISAGPLFKFNPSVSFLVNCKTSEEVDALWARLSEGGTPLMELGEYPFSERYGWIQDKYGLSWQLMFSDMREVSQVIVPTIMYVGKVAGKAQEAINFYVDVFHHSAIGGIMRYGPGEEPDAEGTIKYSRVTLEGMEFGAMDSALQHDFAFNEAISFIVHCENQEQVDYYWDLLSAVPEAEQCGWLKDRYGLSWQVVPDVLDEMLGSGDPEKVARVTEAFLPMKKLDIAKLQEAYEG